MVWLPAVLWGLCISLSLVLVIGGGYFLGQKFMAAEPFAFHRVHVVMQADHLKGEQIAKIVRKNLEGGFFSMKTERLQEALMMEPWIADVAFRRVWPDILEVDVEERQPVARWGKLALLTQQGKIFSPQKMVVSDNLPLLSGPRNTEQQVLLMYQRFHEALLHLGVKIQQLELTGSRSWVLTLDQGVEVKLGHEDIDERLKRFIDVYPDIIDKSQSKILSIDLRYANGVAVLSQ